MYVSGNFSDLGKLISNKNDLKWLSFFLGTLFTADTKRLPASFRGPYARTKTKTPA